MTRIVLTALCLLTLLGVAAHGAPTGDAPAVGSPPGNEASEHHSHAGGEHEAEEEDLTAQPPVQAYYHRAFFGEPWRAPEKSVSALYRQSGAVLIAVVAVGLVLGWRRRRWNREAEDA